MATREKVAQRTIEALRRISEDISRGFHLLRGWRSFTCYKCKYRWAEPTRDRFSPSGEFCPGCIEEVCRPERHWPDEELKIDDMGNLLQVGEPDV